MESFQIELPDIGRLLKLRIWHEKRHPFAGWHLGRVRAFPFLVRLNQDPVVRFGPSQKKNFVACDFFFSDYFTEDPDNGEIQVRMRPLARRQRRRQRDRTRAAGDRSTLRGAATVYETSSYNSVNWQVSSSHFIQDGPHQLILLGEAVD